VKLVGGSEGARGPTAARKRGGGSAHRQRRGLGVAELWRGSLDLDVGAAERIGGCAEGRSSIERREAGISACRSGRRSPAGIAEPLLLCAEVG